MAITVLAAMGNGYNLNNLDVARLSLPYEFVGLVASAPFLGVTLSALVCGAVAEQYGRVWASLAGEMVLVTGVSVSSLSEDAWVLALGQFILGLGVGFCSVAKPLYICEKSPGWGRALLMCSWTVLFNLATLLTFFVKWALMNQWRYQVGLGAVPAFVMLFCFGTGWATETSLWERRQQQESPRGPDRRGSTVSPSSGPDRGDELERGLMEGEGVVHNRSDRNATQGQDAPVGEPSEGHCEGTLASKPEGLLGIYASLGAAFVLSAAASLPGLTPMGSEVGFTLQALGLGDRGGAAQLLESLALGSCNLMGGALALWLVGWVDRRRLMLWGMGGCMAALAGTTVSLLVLESPWMSLSCLCMYLWCLTIGPYSLFWVFLPEIFSNERRSFGLAFGVACLHLWQVIFSYSYQPFIAAIGFSWLCVMCAAAMAATFWYSYLYVSEHHFPAMKANSDF